MRLPTISVILTTLLLAPPLISQTILRVPSDFSSIQEAIDQAGVDSTIMVAKGVYAENLVIDSKVGLQIRGNGKVVIDGQMQGTVIRILESQVMLDRLEIVNGSPNGIEVSGGILTSEPKAVSIDRCHVRDFALNGIHVSGDHYPQIKRCFINDGGGHGVLMDSLFLGSVDRTTISNVGGDGVRGSNVAISVSEGAGSKYHHGDTMVSRSRIEDVGGDGIALRVLPAIHFGVTIKRGSVHADRCRVADVAGRGIVIDGAVHHIGPLFSSATKNRIKAVGGTALDISGETVYAFNNRITSSLGGGILFTKEYNLMQGDIYWSSITKNRVSKTAGVGIQVAGLSTRCSLSKNRVSKTAGVGIQVAGLVGGCNANRNWVRESLGESIVVSSSGNSIWKNHVTKSGSAGIVIESTDNYLEKNIVSKSSDSGFLVTQGGNTLVGNRAKKSGAYDLSDTSDGSNDYLENMFKAIDPSGNQP
jgi:parallel beta-helix repeat protein